MARILEAIHKNEELDDPSKYAYLKSLLTGRAATTSAGLTQSQLSNNDALKIGVH